MVWLASLMGHHRQATVDVVFLSNFSASHMVYGYFGGGEGSITRDELLAC